MRYLVRWSFLALVATVPAFGCLCDYDLSPSCQRLRSYEGSALFVGVVTDIHYREVSISGIPVRQQVVSFSIEDAFVGVQGRKVTVVSFADAGMCGYPFQKNRSYLVDANGSMGKAADVESHLGVNSCGMTTPAAEAGDSIRFLKLLRDHPIGGILFGTVKQYAQGASFVPLNNKPIVGTSVLLEAVPGIPLERRKTVVDSEGWYEFVDVPESMYTLSAQVPNGFTGELNHTVEMHRDGCAQLDVRVHREAP